MIRPLRWLTLAGVFVLGGCTLLDPFPTTPSVPSPGQIGGERVAICYNTLSTTLDEVKTHAQAECSAGAIAQPVDTDWNLQRCPMLLPTHATFACTPTGTPKK
jgi:hypothetical protein